MNTWRNLSTLPPPSQLKARKEIPKTQGQVRKSASGKAHTPTPQPGNTGGKGRSRAPLGRQVDGLHGEGEV